MSDETLTPFENLNDLESQLTSLALTKAEPSSLEELHNQITELKEAVLLLRKTLLALIQS